MEEEGILEALLFLRVYINYYSREPHKAPRFPKVYRQLTGAEEESFVPLSNWPGVVRAPVSVNNPVTVEHGICL